MGMENHKEIVYTLPMQIKKNISVGNLYDFVIADFISTFKSQEWIDVTKPIAFNINWQKTVDLLAKEWINLSDIDSVNWFLENCKKDILNNLSDFWINFSYEIDDNKISDEINTLMNTYDDVFLEWPLIINKCTNCGKEFWTDFSIHKCKYCDSKTFAFESKKEIYQNINSNELLEKLENIKREPIWAKKKVITYIKSLPENYLLQLSKEKWFTLEYNEKSLDPRFVMVVSLLLDSIKATSWVNKTIIHWDVIKKYDYYMLCHTKPEDLPQNIIAHWYVMWWDGKKIKWDPLTQSENNLWWCSQEEKKLLRCILLKNDIFKWIKLDINKLADEEKWAAKYYTKIMETLNTSQVDYNLTDNELIRDYWHSFVKFANNLRFWMCYDLFTKMVKVLWDITRDRPFLSKFEYDCLTNLLLLYYWEKWQ